MKTKFAFVSVLAVTLSITACNSEPTAPTEPIATTRSITVEAGSNVSIRESGTVTGEQDASAFAEECVGWVPSAPQLRVTIEAGQDIEFIANSTDETTISLVVRQSDDVRCVQSPESLLWEEAVGEFEVFAGTMEQGGSSSFYIDIVPVVISESSPPDDSLPADGSGEGSGAAPDGSGAAPEGSGAAPEGSGAAPR